MVTPSSIEPTLSHLAPISNRIAGIASLSYRLSPYPSHPTCPSSPDEKSRNVKHPAHIEDILTAIAWLQQKYGFGERYMLVGHSCGATLALQTVMKEWSAKSYDGTENVEVIMPLVVLGVEGLYDLPLLRDTHQDSPMYQQFLEGAFGHDETNWKGAHPIRGRLSHTWENGRALVIAHSRDDELVDWAQVDSMKDSMQRESTIRRTDVILELKGKHNNIWKDGREMARAIENALDIVTIQE